MGGDGSNAVALPDNKESAKKADKQIIQKEEEDYTSTSANSLQRHHSSQSITLEAPITINATEGMDAKEYST